jgi:hypothetical protein
MTTISAPVGERGRLPSFQAMNRPEDVRTIQRLLNGHAAAISLGRPLAETGTCDRNLIGAIQHFQADVVGLRQPDGRVDPNGQTLRALDRTPGHGRRQGTERPPVASHPLRRGLILRPRHNQEGRHDVTGAFQPGAEAFQRIHHLPPPVVFDNQAADAERRSQVINGIRNADGPLEVIAYFGHGVTNGLSSARLYHRHIPELSEAIRGNTTRNAVIVLYACSAGAFGAWAEALANSINERRSSSEGFRVVYGHTNAAHSFYNPNVTYFPQGEYVVPPGTREFRAWRRHLRIGDLWARFPFMRDSEIDAEIEV